MSLACDLSVEGSSTVYESQRQIVAARIHVQLVRQCSKAARPITNSGVGVVDSVPTAAPIANAPRAHTAASASGDVVDETGGDASQTVDKEREEEEEEEDDDEGDEEGGWH